MRIRLFKISPLIVITLLLTQCTIEKRLYNNGYHVEWKKSPVKSSQTEASVEKTEQNNFDIPIENNQEGNSALTETQTDSISPQEVKDTLLSKSSTSGKNWSSEKKKNTLISLGAATFSSAMLATHFLLKATAPGANYFAYTFLGFLGEALAITAAILLIIFIVSLFVRPNDQPKKEPKSNLTKRVRIALMILSVVLASIGLITLVLNLFG